LKLGFSRILDSFYGTFWRCSCITTAATAVITGQYRLLTVFTVYGVQSATMLGGGGRQTWRNTWSDLRLRVPCTHLRRGPHGVPLSCSSCRPLVPMIKCIQQDQSTYIIMLAYVMELIRRAATLRATFTAHWRCPGHRRTHHICGFGKPAS